MKRYFLICLGLAAILLASDVLTQAAAKTDGKRMQEMPAGCEDATLRVDYMFTGNDSQAYIFLDRLSRSEGWYGRRVNTDSLLLKGNGSIVMTDPQSGKVLYCNSFSTLFQEWQATEEATKVSKSFENVFLLPMPSAPADVTVTLYDFRNRPVASLTHRVDPADILIRSNHSQAAPHKWILRSGPSEECIDVAIIAEGYTAKERKKFYKDAQAAVDALLSHEPFGQYKDRFNFVAVALPSAESGVSVPLEGDWKDTPLHSHFSTFYSDRYLTTLNIRDLHDAMTGIPYEHFIILANTDVYGGGGIFNSYTLTTAHHPLFRPVVVHEFGHSFGGLADEYYYDDMFVEYYYSDTEPWEQNITTLYDFKSKWADMLAPGTPVPTPATQENENVLGVYEGAGYQSKGVYRGWQQCRMLNNTYPTFCPVCRRALENIILWNTEQD